MEDRTKVETFPAELPNGAKVLVQATVVGGREAVIAGVPSFTDVTKTLEGIAESMVSVWDKVKPSKASVEFGLQIGIESGQLTAMFVKGTGSADLKVTMEWESSRSGATEAR